MFISCYTARNEPKNRVRGLAPLTPSDPRAERGARVPNKAIKKQRLLVTDAKGCVGERTRVVSLGDTVKRGAPMLNREIFD